MKQTLVFLMGVIVSLIWADFGPIETVMEDNVAYSDNGALTTDADGNIYYVAFKDHHARLYVINSYGYVYEHWVPIGGLMPDADYSADILVEDDHTIHIVVPGSFYGFAYAVSHDMGENFEWTNVNCPTNHPRLVVTDDAVSVVCYSHRNKRNSHCNLFMDKPKSEFDMGVIFKGTDEFFGPVHCNDDIWIYQGGGGNNNGYPTFHGLVTTTGQIRMYPSGAPVQIPECIFLGGWVEDVPHVDMITTDQIRSNGSHPVTDPETDIFYVKIDGNSWSSMIGKITETYQDIPVYSWFPQDAAQVQAVIDTGGNWYEDANVVHVNHVAVRDTIWTVGPGGAVNGGSVFIDYGKLWIEGCTQGMITFGCADSIIITGDLTYANTPVGQSPSGDDFNTTDLLGLISEESVIVGYKNYDPWIEERNEANCDDVYLYGVFAAIGEGDPQIYGNMARHHDGMFTFEYQHPHGSTPSFVAPSPYTLQDTVYTLVDFQRNIFPPTSQVAPEIMGFNLHGGNPPAGYPCSGYPYTDPQYLASYPNANPASYAYPGGTDWPYYNPVWPESSDEIVFERGTLHLWGSVIQRRMGYLHRSGDDSNNHPANGEWDIVNQHFDGVHPSCGYERDYQYDERLQYVSPVDFSQANLQTTETIRVFSSNPDSLEFYEICEQELQADNATEVLVAQDGETVVVVATHPTLDCMLMVSHDAGQSFSTQPFVNQTFGDLEQLTIADGTIYGFDDDTDSFYQIFEDGTTEELGGGVPQTFENPYAEDFVAVNDNLIMGRVVQDGMSFNFDFSYLSPDYNAAVQSFDLPLEAPCQTMKIDDIPGDALRLTFSQGSYLQSIHRIFQTQGTLDGLTAAGYTSKPNGLTLSNHPNPFNPSTEICFSLSSEQYEQDEPVAIEIFNIKGQKVKTIPIDINKLSSRPSGARGEISSTTTWDGTDISNRPVASGLYLYQLKVGGTAVAQRKMMLLK
jgi:hypothetical protein